MCRSAYLIAPTRAPHLLLIFLPSLPFPSHLLHPSLLLLLSWLTLLVRLKVSVWVDGGRYLICSWEREGGRRRQRKGGGGGVIEYV